MKRLSGSIVLLLLIGVTTTAKAVDCRVNGGRWTTLLGSGTINLQVPVNVRLDSAVDRILLEGANLQCRYTPGPWSPSRFSDFWRTGSNPWTAGAKFARESTGLRINGSYRNNPIPAGISVITMSDNGFANPINITPYIVMRKTPSNPIDIRVGDSLGVLRMVQTNNEDNRSVNLVVRYIAANNFTVSPSTCTINNNNPIEINFGDVNQRAIGTDPLSTSIRSERTLTYSCPDRGITMPITITYKGTASSFHSDLLGMSNRDVGTALIRMGSAVRVNGSFRTQITDSTGSDDVTFTLVKRAGSTPATGAVSGSGVLLMGVP